jgi:hypothetical protein
VTITQPFTLQPSLQIHSDAHFIHGRTRRLRLRRWWTTEPKRWISWLMLNPSYASELRTDLTTLRVLHFSQAWGYDGYIVVNLYPFITPDPKEMWFWARWPDNGPDWHARDAMQANLVEIEATARISALRVVAFGAEPVKRDSNWVMECLERYSQPFDDPDCGFGFDEEHFWCLGKTQSGQPIHPLARGKHRVLNTTVPMIWERA